MSDLYDTDFVKWAEEQTALLTERRFDLRSWSCMCNVRLIQTGSKRGMISPSIT